MKLDCSQPINTLKGVPFKSDGEALTLGQVISEALAVDQTGGKMKLYALAQKAFASTEIEIDSADLSLIKRAVAECKSFQGNALILGQALEMLEGVKAE